MHKFLKQMSSYSTGHHYHLYSLILFTSNSVISYVKVLYLFGERGTENARNGKCKKTA